MSLEDLDQASQATQDPTPLRAKATTVIQGDPTQVEEPKPSPMVRGNSMRGCMVKAAQSPY